jgi:hypothetical protein
VVSSSEVAALDRAAGPDCVVVGWGATVVIVDQADRQSRVVQAYLISK